MTATALAAQDIFQDDPDSQTASRIDPCAEDAHWSRYYQGESYFRAGMDYEDYAAAYCVGCIGFLQYGGSYEDAEKSLCSNWVRLKGDSRLSIEEALPAMRAAWDRWALAANQTPL